MRADRPNDVCSSCAAAAAEQIVPKVESDVVVLFELHRGSQEIFVAERVRIVVRVT